MPNTFLNHGFSYRGLNYGGIKASVSLGFFYPTQRLMGLSENEDSPSMLLTNTGTDPYELFNLDYYRHPINVKLPSYSSIPYVMSLN